MPSLSVRAVLLGAGTAMTLAAATPSSPAWGAPPRRASGHKAPAASGAAKAHPSAPLEIKCGPPLRPQKPKPKGLAKLSGVIHAAPKLPEVCVLARFKDPAFPVIDPKAPSAPIGLYGPGGLFSGTGPVEAKWTETIREFQAVADEIADYGPRPGVRAEVRLNQLELAESHAVFEGPPGHGGVIVLSTRLVQSLRALSEGQAADGSAPSDQIAQQYLKFIIAHEYAHLVLNHPQQLAKSEDFYQELGQAIQLAGMVYAVANGVSTGKNVSYLQQQAKAKQSLGVLLGASFVGEIVSTEGTRFLFPVFNRSVERDADMLAADILERTANGSPITGAQGLKVFYHQNEDNLRHNAQLSEDAQKSVNLAAVQVAAAVPALIEGDTNQAMKQLKVAAITTTLTFASRKLEEHRMMVEAHLHDSPDARDALVTAYVAAFYDEEAQVTRPVANFDAVMPQAKIAAGVGAKPKIRDVNFKKVGAEVDAFEACEAAKSALAKGAVAAARSAINAALHSPIKDDAEVQRIAGAVASAEGKPDEAIRHFRAVLAAGANGSDVWRDIIVTQRSKGDLAGAIKTIDEAGKKTDQPKAFILMKIEIHGQQKNDKAVADDLFACKAFNDGALYLRCQQLDAEIKADAKAPSGGKLGSAPVSTGIAMPKS